MATKICAVIFITVDSEWIACEVKVGDNKDLLWHLFHGFGRY